MTRLPLVRDLAAGAAGIGYFLCCAKEVRQGRNGAEFISVTLQDNSGLIVGRVFDNVADLGAEFEAGEFVKVQAKCQQYRNQLQLVIERIRRTSEADRQHGFREEDLVPVSPRPLDEMWAELQDLVAAVREPFIRTLLDRIIADNESRLRTWPAGQRVHHAYRGGFLEHVLKVADVGRAIATRYDADADLVIAGALLHDIGKLRELDYDLFTSYTRDGNLLGHITLGVLLVNEAIAAIPGFPDDLRAHLVHLVVSHHGDRALGSPVVPMTVEAFILSMVDDLDATLHQARRLTTGTAGDGEFTTYDTRLERVLWRGRGAVITE